MTYHIFRLPQLPVSLPPSPSPSPWPGLLLQQVEEPLGQHGHLSTQRLQQIADENGQLLLLVLDGVRAVVLAQHLEPKKGGG